MKLLGGTQTQAPPLCQWEFFLPRCLCCGFKSRIKLKTQRNHSRRRSQRGNPSSGFGAYFYHFPGNLRILLSSLLLWGSILGSARLQQIQRSAGSRWNCSTHTLKQNRACYSLPSFFKICDFLSCRISANWDLTQNIPVLRAPGKSTHTKYPLFHFFTIELISLHVLRRLFQSQRGGKKAPKSQNISGKAARHCNN